MYIEPTRLLKVDSPNVKYDLEEKFYEGCTGADWGNDSEIEKAMAADNNKDNNEKDLQEKNRQLKKEKQCLKQRAARARAR